MDDDAPPSPGPEEPGSGDQTGQRSGSGASHVRKTMRILFAVGLLALVGAVSCSSGPTGTEDCGPFPDWSSSPYLLPYPPGEAWQVNQSNCSGKGHSGFWKFGYDFAMPIGAAVTAAQAGDTIGLSGNSGYTAGFPHLHFSLHPCNELPGLPGAGDCPTKPLTFSNTDPNPKGLEAKRTYRAR
ncbi:MAG: M23 family metallopeptidase [Gemmatimonadetes bacterium]|nr:M23 family metallopeptidase [Gemmatimonadota bacterium]